MHANAFLKCRFGERSASFSLALKFHDLARDSLSFWDICTYLYCSHNATRDDHILLIRYC